MDTTAQKISEEPTDKDTSSNITQSTKNGGNTTTGKISSSLHRLSAPWVFNSFNGVILLVILFLLILQPHWKKGNPTTGIGNESTGLLAPLKDLLLTGRVDESGAKTPVPRPGDSQTQQWDGIAATETDYVDCIKKASELFERKEYEQALTEYNKIANQSAPSTDEDLIQYRLGECYQKLGRLDEALAAYRKIVTEHFQSPYLVRAKLREGECFVDKGDFLKARKLLFTLAAQEAGYSDEDKGFVAEAYYKIAESYMKEALRYARIQGYTFANEKQ